jgi:DNA invertase Pin-like site-specific DNA recombinase
VWEQSLHKLNATDRERIIRLHRDDGVTASAIAKRFHVSDATVSRILDEERKAAKPGGWGHREGYGEV